MFVSWKEKTIIFFTGKFQMLTLSLLAMIIFSPYLMLTPIGHWSLSIMYSIVLLTAIYSLSEKKHNLFLFSILAGFYILISFIDFLSHSFTTELIERVLLIIFGISSTVALFNEIEATDEVTTDTYFAAISVYILIGVTYGTIYSLIELLHPGSFFYQHIELSGSTIQMQLTYYSLITLTTVGYGDIVVISQFAKPFVILESITGIFYLAMLVARLISTRK